jgi:hypothetical protein
LCYFDGHIKNLGKLPEKELRAVDQMMQNNAQLWAQADKINPNKFKVFRGNTDHVVFQFPVDRRSHRESQYFPWWGEWKDVLMPLIHEATHNYRYANGKTCRILLGRLFAGQRCILHVDNTISANIPHKIHIPLQTHPDVQFLIEGCSYFLERGHAYEVNNKLVHGTNNPSPIDRVHLIFDYYNE